jgi:hypothetical protein
MAIVAPIATARFGVNLGGVCMVPERLAGPYS